MRPFIGFVLVTHSHPEQTLFLCSRLSIMFNDPPIAIHHDFSQCALDKALFPANVRFVETWYRTGWGVISVVDALLSALRLLYTRSDEADWGDPDWVVSLSSTDYPIQTAAFILEELRSTVFDGFLDGRAIRDPGGPFLEKKLGEFPFQQPRYQQFAFRRYVGIPLLSPNLARRLNIPVERHVLRSPRWTERFTPFRGNLQCYAGDAWMTIRRNVAQVLLNETALWRKLYEHYRHRASPEESFYQTLLGNTPGLNLAPNNLRYSDWREQYAHPRTLGQDDLPRLLASSHHFARKFPFDESFLTEIDRAVALKDERARLDPPDDLENKPAHVPAVAVIIPTYNCAQYLPKAIESVLAQTFTDLEIIVVDDGSTDETPAAVAPYLARITYIRQENRGLPGARNRGIRATNAPLIALLDADDSWLPEKLAMQLPLLIDPTVNIVYSDFAVEYTDGRRKPSYLAERPLASEGFIFDNYIRSRFLFPSTMLLRRAAMEDCHLFNEQMLACEDIELFARMCLRGKVTLVKQPLVIRSEGAHNLTANIAKIRHYTIRALHMVLGGEPSMSRRSRRVVKRELALQYWYQGHTAFRAGKLAEARSHFARVIRYNGQRASRAALLLLASLLPQGLRRRLQGRQVAEVSA